MAGRSLIFFLAGLMVMMIAAGSHEAVAAEVENPCAEAAPSQAAPDAPEDTTGTKGAAEKQIVSRFEQAMKAQLDVHVPLRMRVSVSAAFPDRGEKAKG